MSKSSTDVPAPDKSSSDAKSAEKFWQSAKEFEEDLEQRMSNLLDPDRRQRFFDLIEAGREQAKQRDLGSIDAVGGSALPEESEQSGAASEPSVCATAVAGDAVADVGMSSGTHLRQVPIENLHPNPTQLRAEIDEKDLANLATSLKDHGLLQPIVARGRPGHSGEYEVIAGERRRRAAKIAGLTEVPVLVRPATDRAAREQALIENIQRQDLNPLEEAEGYRRLIEEFEHTHEELAQVVGKSRSHIANTLRLLNSTPMIRGLVQEGRLASGHARALLTSDKADEFAGVVLSQGLTVRETELLVQRRSPKAAHRSRANPKLDPELEELRNEFAELLDLKVKITASGEARSLIIDFSRARQLRDILDILRRGVEETVDRDAVGETLAATSQPDAEPLPMASAAS